MQMQLYAYILFMGVALMSSSWHTISNSHFTMAGVTVFHIHLLFLLIPGSLVERWCHRWTHQSGILKVMLLFVYGVWQTSGQYYYYYKSNTNHAPGEIIQMFATAGVHPLLPFLSLTVHSREIQEGTGDRSE